MTSAFTAAVVIPARNEARRLPTCLSALLPQIGEDVLVVVVANNCTDSTIAAARASIPSRSLELIDCTFDAAQGVGEARLRGCARALSFHPDIQSLLTTDADCIAAPDWITRSRAHLAEVHAVCGLVEPIPTESGVFQRLPSQAGANEAIYRDLVIQFYDLIAPEPHNPYPHHGVAAGATLACRASALRLIGGFADLCTGEDRDLIRRMRAADFRVRHASDVRVQASCRLIGRAPGGMADTIRHRLTDSDYLVDEALPSVTRLLDMARRGALEAWPPQLPVCDRLHLHDLPHQIALLKGVLARLRVTQDLSSTPPPLNHAHKDHELTLPRAALAEARFRHLAHGRSSASNDDDAHDGLRTRAITPIEEALAQTKSARVNETRQLGE